MRRAKLVVTHDTGLMHIAAAFKRPIVSIWGNTVPEFGMYPYYGENYINHFRPTGQGGRRNGVMGSLSVCDDGGEGVMGVLKALFQDRVQEMSEGSL